MPVYTSSTLTYQSPSTTVATDGPHVVSGVTSSSMA